MPGLSAIFSPETVALVGVSDDPAKTSGRPLAYLKAGGWTGDVFAVNPTRSTVQGQTAYAALRDLPRVPDHVMVLTGAEKALTVLTECVDLGVPVVTILADGFTPHDARGVQRIAELKTAIGGRTRVLGPSSLGVVRPATGLRLTANAVFGEPDLPCGSVVVASQSGSAIGSIVSRGKDMGIGFHSLVSTGSELDLNLGEICQATVDDPTVSGYLLFLEHLAGAAGLRSFAAAAAASGKPIVAYKLGRTVAAATLSVTHTGSLAGDDAVATAFLSDIGIARVLTFDALLEAHELAAALPAAVRQRPRVAVVTTTGGGGAMAVDCLAARGLEVGGLAPDTVGRLAALGIDAGDSLVDLTLAGTRYDVMRGALDVLTTADEVDLVVAVPGSSARLQPELVVRPIADSVGASTPVVCFMMPSAPSAARMLREAGVASFRTPESCADAVAALLSRRPMRQRAVALEVSGPTRVLDELEGHRLLSAAGVNVAPYAVVRSEPTGALPVPGPVAVKLLSHEVAHKSDIGGVRLGIKTATELGEAIEAIRQDVAVRAPGLVADRFLVQTMASGVEVLVGIRREPYVGPVVVLAAGGVLAELIGASVVRLAPVTTAEAHCMIDELPTVDLLRGFRGAPMADLDQLAELIVAVSSLATDAHVVEAEVNPVVVGTAGTVAVDALVRVLLTGDDR